MKAMSEANSANKWNREQELAIRFLAAGKTDTSGKKWTADDFCNTVLKIHPTTLSRWKANSEFRQAVLEETMGRVADFIPAMVQAQVAKSVKKQDTQAFMAIMRQSGVLRSDKQDIQHGGEVGITLQTVDYKDAE